MLAELDEADIPDPARSELLDDFERTATHMNNTMMPDQTPDGAGE